MKTLKKILAIFVCVSLVSTTLVDTSIVQATEIFNNENENISEESVNNDLSSGRNSEDVALDTTEDSEATTTEVTVEDNTEEEATTETTTETVTEGETEQEVPVNGVYLSYYDEDEINDLLFTEWAFGLTEEETTRAFGMTMEDFVAFRKATKAKKWSEEGYLESLVLAEVIELSSDEDFREWVTDEQLETCFGMDRETFETLSDSGISFVEEVIDRQMAVSGGGALSGRVFYSNYSANYSWRDNWWTRSMANYNRTTSYASATGNTFKMRAAAQLTNSYNVGCNQYVYNVLKANGENIDQEYTTKTFESWLLGAGGYYLVNGGWQQTIDGSTKTYTGNADAILGQIQSGDILLWANQNSDGSYTPSHISIGYVWDNDTSLAGYVDAAESGNLQVKEVCVFQSNGSGVRDIESVAYYLSGARTQTSYGSAVKIFRKSPVTGSVSVSKRTTTGGNKSGVKYALYKVSTGGARNGGTSLLNADTSGSLPTGLSLSTTSLNLSGLTDSSISASYNGNSGMLTLIATFTTNSDGVGVPTLSTGIKNAHNTAVSNNDYGDSWYKTEISGNTIKGLPIGDYILIEQKDTVNQTYWKKGGSYSGTTLDSTTVNCTFAAKAGDGGFLTINGMASGSVNKLCDFGFGVGKQYYAAFTIENSASSTWRNVSIDNKNMEKDTEDYDIQIYKNSNNSNATSSCAGATYGLYATYNDANNNTNSKGTFTIGSTYTTTSLSNGGTVSGYYSNVISVAAKGTYYIKETKAPTNNNYVLDSNIYSVVVDGNTNVTSLDVTLKQVYDTPKPYVNVKKSSTVTGSTPSMAGITYRVYQSESDAKARNNNQSATITVKADGSSDLVQLPSYGTYYIIEYQANTYYNRSDTVYTVTFTANNTRESQSVDYAEMCKTVQVADAPNGISLRKASANTTVTNDNSCYSVRGATYAVYEGKTSATNATKDNYTTLSGYAGALVVQDDTTGLTNTLYGLAKQNYYVKEVISPKGYAIDTTVYTCNLADSSKITNNVYTLSVTDKPQMDPINVLLTKKDSTDGTKVAGAEITVKYYKGEYADGVDPATTGAKPERTWVITTDTDGYADLQNATGSELYKNDAGQVVLPLGTVTLQETKAPAHYKINSTVFVRRITSSGNSGNVSTYNAFDLTETPYRKPVCFNKLGETTTSGRFNALANAGFMIAPVSELKKDADGNYIWDRSKAIAFNSNGTADNYNDDTLELFTDSNGYALSARLKDGTYLMHETTVPENYVAIDDVIFTIDTSDMTDDTISNPTPLNLGYFSDDRFKGYLKIVKKDKDTNANILNTDGDIKFKIWSYDDNKYLTFKVYDAVKGANVTISEFALNNDGYVVTPDTLMSGKFRLEEINTGVKYYSENPAATYDFTINNQTVYEMYVDGDGEVTDVPVFTVTMDNTPVYANLKIHKVGEYYEEENGKYIKKDAALGNVTFEVVADGDIISSDGQTKLYKSGDVVGTMVTDTNGDAELNNIPFGRYIIRESAEADGYYKMADVKFEVSSDDEITTVTAADGTVKKYVSVEKTLVNYRKITVRTSASGKSGIRNVKAEKNATIYDDVFMTNLIVGKTYTIKGVLMDAETGKKLTVNGKTVTAEKTFKATDGVMTVQMQYNLDASSLQGKKTVVFENLYEGTTEVAAHNDLTDTDQTISFPSIGTTAVNGITKEHISYTYKDAVITDTVKYTGLIVGREYTVSGVLMDKQTGEPLLIDGEKVTAETTFTAKTENGTVDVVFTFDASYLAGKSLVAFEDAYNENYNVATHADIEDEEQTVHYPKIGTTATADDTEDHITQAREKVTITDVVAYENLIKGREYTVSGVLVNKETGEKLLDAEGNEIVSEKTFTAETSDGEVSLDFTFDASLLAGTTIVVFEDVLYKDELVASHADIEDTEQTVEVPKIGTTATADDTNDHITQAREEVTITDVVAYTHLLAGKEYTVSGVLMNKETGEKLLDAEGNDIVSEKTFTAETSDGEVSLDFTFDASLLAGTTIVVFENVMYKDIKVAAHADIEDTEQTVEVPKIGTKATDKATNDHISLAGEKTTITDVVSYTHLIVGKEYTVSGILMNKETNLPLIAGNNLPVAAEKTFVPEAPDGEVSLDFTFDSSLLAGTTIVVFENVKTLGITVATHADIEDTEQTIHFPKIGTVAKEKTKGTHTTMSADRYDIVDTVSYENLPAGRTYKVEGTLIDRSTGKAVSCDGSDVTAETVFTPETESGSVDVEFSFGGRSFAGLSSVVFEELYIIEETDDETETGEKDEAETETEQLKVPVAVHKDADDEGQSIYIDYTKAAFDKVDASTGEAVAGADLSLYDSNGKLVENWISNGTEHIINNLEAGRYTLVENVSPKGYEVAGSITFDLKDIGEKQTITMEDDVIKGRVHITKVDNLYPDKTLSGVTFNLYKTGDTIMDTSIDRGFATNWNNLPEADKEKADSFKAAEDDLYIGTYITDDNGEFDVDNLTYGMYYLVETDTQSGYIRLTDITGFVIDEENTDVDLVIENEGRVGWIVYHIEYRDTPASRGRAVKTGDVTPIAVVAGVMLVALGMVIILAVRRKKSKKLLMLLPIGLVLVSQADVSVKAAEAEDEYVETKQAEYDTDDKTKYDLGFDEEIDIDGVTYKLDGIDYDVTNKYDSEMNGRDIEYTITRTYTDVARDYEPEKSIKENGYTYLLKNSDVKVDKYTPVEIETSVDSEYGTAEHKNTVTYTYTDEKSGKQYEVELPYIRSEVISSGYVIPITLTGTLGDYSSEYFIYNGTRYSNPKDDISDIENLLVDFVTSAGYNSDDYRDFSYGYSGDAYYNADGILVRDFYVSFDIYGEKYRFYYGDTFDALVGTYSAECTYELDDTTKKELEEMKGQYEVTGNARYIRQTAVAKKKFYQTTVGKAVISAAVIFVILIIISLFIYLARGGRKSTDYRSRRDSERDYREL